MNKKSVVFSWALVIFSIIILVYALVAFSGKYDKFELNPIGEKQFELIKLYQENDKVLFFIDKSASYAATKAIYELADKGIVDIENEFATIFNSNLNQYLNLYTDYNIPQDNYDITISTEAGKSQVLGFAINNLELQSKKNIEGELVVEETKTTTGKTEVDQQKYLKAKERIEANNYNPLIEKYSTLNNIDPDLVRALITHESVADKDALSGSNARGLMQIIPKWHRDTCKKHCNVQNDNELFDQEKNICCGTKILKDYNNNKKINWECCDSDVCVTTDYYGWESALRQYNTKECKNADADYVETILGYYEIWSGTEFNPPKETVKKVTQNKISLYSIKPNFKVNIDFDLNIFNEIKKQSDELIAECSEKENDELTVCVANKIKDFTPEWIFISNSEKDFNFEINTHKILPPFTEEVIIKPTISFPQTP